MANEVFVDGQQVFANGEPVYVNAGTVLRFQDSPATNGDLVFGAEHNSGAGEVYTLALDATLPSLKGGVAVTVAHLVECSLELPGLSGGVAVAYSNNVARPEVAQVLDTVSVAAKAESGISDTIGQGVQTHPQVAAIVQDAKRISEQLAGMWAEAERQAQYSVSAMQDALALQPGQLQGLMQEADTSARVSTTDTAQDGDGRRASLGGLFQEAYHDRRRWVESPWQVAQPRRIGVSTGYTYALQSALRFGLRYQDGRRPPAGVWVRPVVPVVPPAPISANLLFICPQLYSAHLVFGKTCITEVGQSLLSILPARFYMTAHSIYAQRLPDLVDVPIFDATVSTDSGSYCWNLSANGPVNLFELLAPQNGLPVSLRLTLDGIPWVFAIDSISRSVAFGKSTARIQGRSVTSLIAAPYVRDTAFGNAFERTAQQLAEEALTNTGIGLDWGLEDWLVPAGVWSAMTTPLSAVQAIAQSAGGYLQSHKSAPTLLTRHPYSQRAGDLPGAPWGWLTGAADVELATDALITESTTRNDGSKVNGVYVSGTSSGVLALVRRTGTAADSLSAMITDPLITSEVVARQRGLAVLGAAGIKHQVGIELPVLTGVGQPGVLEVGQLVQVNAAVPWRGRVRAVSVSAKQPTLRQSVTLERHLETA